LRRDVLYTPSECSRACMAGWRFSRERGAWLPSAACEEDAPVVLDRPLRLATLNVLHDNTLGEVLHHEVRYDAICTELATLDADVIGLNECTVRFLERVLREEWVRDRYTVSAVADDATCAHVVSTAVDAALGNLLLSRLRPSTCRWLEQPGDGRHSHAMTFYLSGGGVGGGARRVAVCSTHLTACPWLMEGRRKLQLEQLAAAVVSGGLDAPAARSGCVILGDFNFHREAENASIPPGWAEVPAVVALGATWDIGRNAMLPHYLPRHNLYNGLGLGVSLGWPSPMRLDRVIVRGPSFGVAGATARLFANEPVHTEGRGRAPLPQTGRALREAWRTVPWQEYLYPSDHFGIVVELPLSS